MEEIRARIEKREGFAKMSLEEMNNELSINKERLQSLETELKSVELATDITPNDKLFKIPRLRTKMNEVKENIEMLEEIISGKE